MIAQFEKPVIDVPDLDEGARFWSALTGFEIGESFDPLGRFLGLGRHEVDGHMSVRLLLQKADHPITAGSTHLDYKVRDIANSPFRGQDYVRFGIRPVDEFRAERVGRCCPGWSPGWSLSKSDYCDQSGQNLVHGLGANGKRDQDNRKKHCAKSRSGCKTEIKLSISDKF